MEGFDDLVDEKPRDVLPSRVEARAPRRDERREGRRDRPRAARAVPARPDLRGAPRRDRAPRALRRRGACAARSRATPRRWVGCTSSSRCSSACRPPRCGCARLSAVVAGTRGVKLFGEIGLPNDRGLLAETTDRLARRFLPEAARVRTSCGCSRAASSASRRDLDWLGPAPIRCCAARRSSAAMRGTPLRASILDAIGMITTRIAALGMAEAFRTRTTVGGVRERRCTSSRARSRARCRR